MANEKVSFDAKMSELQQGLQIDKNALEEALIEQVNNFADVADLLANYASERDAAKQALQEAQYNADEVVRHDLEMAGKKIREAEVEAGKMTDRNVRARMKEKSILEDRVGRLQAMKEAYQQRGYVLKELCSLWIAGYYGDPASNAVSQVKNQNRDATRRAMAEERNRR